MQPTALQPEAPRSDVVPAKFAHASGSRPLDGYTIKRGVGSGGFGEVYYATSDGGKDVALKLIRRNLDIELRGVRQCLNLKHPNLLGLYDVRVDTQGNSWVVMEYVAGQCLEEVLNAHPNGLPLAEALDWFRGVAGAVAYLHDHGIVHRDLKPGNIFRDQGLVKLGDYGLTKFISVSRRSGQTESIGTVHYMAPEIANGRYGKEIDLYALGILLYELMTGHVPFEGESVGEVLMKHLTAEPDLGRLAEPYRSLVRDCLAKDPAARPHSASEIVARLDGGSAAPQAASKPWPAARPAVSPPVFASLAVPHDNSLATAWHELHPIAKLLLGGGACLAMMLLGGPIWTVIFVLAVSGYLNKRQPSTYRTSAAPRLPRPIPLPEAPQPATRMTFRGQAQKLRAQAAFVLRSPRERWADLLGSLLLAPLVAAVAVALVTIFRGEHVQPALLAWQWSVASVGSWLVLIPAKLWEATPGDQWRRRFVMLLAGMVLGSFAWWLDDFLFIDLHYGRPILPEMTNLVGEALYAADGQPLLMGYLRYFALLMVVPRWWLQADPLRKRRVSLWSTAVVVAISVLLGAVSQFPQPWAMIVAGTMSLSLQLAGPWQNPKGGRHVFGA